MKTEVESLKEENANLIRHIKSNSNQISEMGKIIDELEKANIQLYEALKPYDTGEDENIKKALSLPKSSYFKRCIEAFNKPQ